jgi:hypothetical protein
MLIFSLQCSDDTFTIPAVTQSLRHECCVASTGIYLEGMTEGVVNALTTLMAMMIFDENRNSIVDTTIISVMTIQFRGSCRRHIS